MGDTISTTLEPTTVTEEYGTEPPETTRTTPAPVGAPGNVSTSGWTPHDREIFGTFTIRDLVLTINTAATVASFFALVIYSRCIRKKDASDIKKFRDTDELGSADEESTGSDSSDSEEGGSAEGTKNLAYIEDETRSGSAVSAEPLGTRDRASTVGASEYVF